MFCRAQATGLWAYAHLVLLNPLILQDGIRVARAFHPLMRLLDLRPLAFAFAASVVLVIAWVHLLNPRLAIGAALGLAVGAGITVWQNRRRRTVRSERELVEVIGPPLLAARPLRPEALRALSQQLLEHWFNGSRTLLPVISVGSHDGRTSLAAALAESFAAMGERTLLIDADFRSPSLHEKYSLKNRGGLADLLDGRGVQLAACRANLAVLVAGAVRADPLELLSRERLRHFLGVLIDTPAAERGPDLEMFAALAGGALVVVRPGEDAARLARLRRRLTRCAARPVAAVFNHSATMFNQT
jgi:Mrp family chromosome partitioning ATPase